MEPEEAPPADFNPLLEAVKYWGNWVLEEARKELAPFYPVDADGSIPVGYLWARTIPCQNPACGAEIPLMRQFWLAKKKNRQIALHPVVREGRVEFEIVARGSKAAGRRGLPSYSPWPDGFDPSRGTVRRAVATCPVCGGTVDAKTTRRLFREGEAGQRMVAVVTTRPGVRGKLYRLPTAADREAYAAAERALAEKRAALRDAWGMDPVPNEPLPPKGTLGFRVQGYGIETWGDLFNPRQQLALITFAEKVREAHERMVAEGYEPEFAKAVATYLALVIDELSRFTSTLNPWKVDAEAIVHVFGRQALPMLWDYDENNPLGMHGGTWTNRIKEMISVWGNISDLCRPPAVVTCSSATRLPYPDAYFDAVLTDPPYYDNVPYAYLSDFFYVWLKRTVGHLYPDLFATPLTPKGEEIVAYTRREGGFEAGKRLFEERLARAFREIHRVLKPDGIAVIVYAYKT
ncbi:MAG: DUF1156 domain-containing protein, partial [Chloroflexi bacterium]